MCDTFHFMIVYQMLFIDRTIFKMLQFYANVYMKTHEKFQVKLK